MSTEQTDLGYGNVLGLNTGSSGLGAVITCKYLFDSRSIVKSLVNQVVEVCSISFGPLVIKNTPVK